MKRFILFAVFSLALIPAGAMGQSGEKVDRIVTRVLQVHEAEMARISDITFRVDSYEKSLDGDGNTKETRKYAKKIYMKKSPEGHFRYYEEFLAYYVDGVRQDDTDLKKLAKEKAEKKKRRGGKDISYDMTVPLKTENRAVYNVTYEGISEKPVDGYSCYLIKVAADSNRAPDEAMDTLLNMLYYIDTASYHMVRVDFAPARMASQFMFKMKDLSMQIRYEPYDDSLWLPARFAIQGKGKAMYMIGIDFAAEEFYTEPVIDGGVEESLFKE